MGWEGEADRSGNGFTLIEILIILSIIGILTSLAYPPFSRLKSNIELRGTALQITSDLRLAQQLAVSKHITSRILFEESGYYIENFKRCNIPLCLRMPDRKTIIFSASGYPELGGTGTIILEDKRGRTKKIIVSSVGRVRVE